MICFAKKHLQFDFILVQVVGNGSRKYVFNDCINLLHQTVNETDGLAN